MKRYVYFSLLLVSLIMLLIYGYVQINPHIEALEVYSVIKEEPRIILDAGHGGFDGGAENKELGIVEKDLNLKIAQKLQKLLLLCGYDVVMTRNSDESTCSDGLKTIRQKKNSDIHNRFELMTENSDDICISIHLNKYDAEYVHGAQVFYAPNDRGSDILAECVQKAFAENLQKDNKRKIKKADKSIFILNNNKVNPSVMVECGFISNIAEGRLLKSPNYQTKIAMTILKGLSDYNTREELENAT